jgi:hypothetical protein
LKDMLGDDEDTLFEALNTLARELPVQAESLKLSSEKENWKELSRNAHKLRSCVMMLCMPRFLSLVELIEKRAGEAAEVETLPELVGQALSSSSAVLVDLNKELEKSYSTRIADRKIA